MEREFRGAYMGMTRVLKRQTVSGPIAWHGSLVMDGQDASGLSYRRNRYYDPNTGRFTQEDPSGLAGGLNVSGFGNGDPVSNSDPYGLKLEDGGKDNEADAKANKQDANHPPRIKSQVWLMRGVTKNNPPASCECDSYARVEYEPLTVAEAVDATTFLGEKYAVEGGAISLILSAAEVPPTLATFLGVGVAVRDAHAYSPQAGDQITETTMESYSEDGERTDRRHIFVIKRADGTVVRTQ